ncbi:NADH-quinone oxidoreductase subunit NuoE [Frigidibacter oleivorans]|uniref:NADH-quinone oxidoreductase subunit NuoE n=1 Tax=Frigidibacter oleivorans TaxID=2487129 RepID=UPI000F8D6CD8|nr:NADH-quinone oxidoreductase subunit NuoE [Frigidibacter oleivorans]
MLRRLAPVQPETFAFTPANLDWARGQITKYPAGRQASAIIPLLYRAQEQEGWLSRAAIEYVADMLDMAHIRALEVATFYFMFQLQPTGSIAHIQVCGTTSCMICGAEKLIEVCKARIAPQPYTLSADGKFTWEEVECLGACANAPAAQIGKDYYEDLTAEGFAALLDELAAGRVPVPGPQNGRYSSEPLTGLTSLKEHESGRTQYNASVQRAVDLGETVKRIDGTEVPLLTPWVRPDPVPEDAPQTEPTPGAGQPADATGITVQEAPADSAAEMPPTNGSPKSPSEAPVTTQEAPMPDSGAQATAPATAGTETETVADAADAGAERPEGAEPAPYQPAGDQGEGISTAGTGERAASLHDEDGDAGAAGTAAGTRPAGLDAPRGGQPDDLQIIEGIGPKMEAMLHSLGFYHFDQIAGWTDADLAWVDQNLTGFRGRASRDRWVAQARIITGEGREEFLRRAKTNDY